LRPLDEPPGEPLCYLEAAHAPWCQRVGMPLRAPCLPCWVPLADVAGALAAHCAQPPTSGLQVGASY
jgi:hypothetical protein